MKIESVEANNRRKVFEVTADGRVWTYPYAKLELRPTADNRVVSVSADDEIGREGFTYILASGEEGTVHIEQVLEYHRDPGYMRDLLLYRLTLEAQRRLADSGLSKREIIARLGTSASQLYRLLDQTNTRKSLGQLLALLYVLDCEVDLVVRARKSA